ncbi:hypothetical protein [Streptomyces sp. NPDC054975]
MNQNLQQDLIKYDAAVVRCGETYKGMSRDERTVRSVAGRHLKEHAPSDRTDPTCTACGGTPWPCAIAAGAITYSDPHSN